MRYFDFLIIDEQENTYRYNGIKANSFQEALTKMEGVFKVENPKVNIKGYNCCERTREE